MPATPVTVPPGAVPTDRELPVVLLTTAPTRLTRLPFDAAVTPEKPADEINWASRAAIVSAVSSAKKSTAIRPLETLPLDPTSVATPRATNVTKDPAIAPRKFTRLPSNPT